MITPICVVGESHPAARMGGAEYQTGLLADELAGRPGVQLTYLARHVPTGEATTRLRYAVRSIGTDAGIRRRAVFFDAPALWRALNELRPALIYQQARQSYTAICAHYARRHDIPFYYHVASDADLDSRWLSLHLSPNTPFDAVEYWLSGWGLRHASHVIVQTEQQRQLLRTRFGREAAVLVRNFQPIPAQLPDKGTGPLQVLWVANFKDVKRPQLFVDLAESFVGCDDLRFIMVGRPAPLRRFAPLMDRLARVSNLAYLGGQPVERVYELMAAAAMHVNTSSFEGFPNTFIQAWARGAIVVSLAVDPDGCLERDGLGYSCGGSFDRLRAVIEELARSPDRRRDIAARALSYAQRNHSLGEARTLADQMIASADPIPRP